MEGKNEADKVEDIMLPGFRFHPTDEELVGFYLKRKIQQKPLSVELIKQLDIYKYDPWDLPKLATVGEKEWYFYCPRDRKYRNSARPNRVTGAGFWKATGTDRPIYSSEGSKCIGLKKSLVFYRGRAAKGVKTDWMMHEFRLPSVTSDAGSCATKKPLDKNIPPNDSWAICRIFKKNNPLAQRALTNSWSTPVLKTNIDSDVFPHTLNSTPFASESLPCTVAAGSGISLCSNNEMPSDESFSTLNLDKQIPEARKLAAFYLPTTEAVVNYILSPLDHMLVNLPAGVVSDVNKASSLSIDSANQNLHSVSYSGNGTLHHQINREEQAFLRNPHSDCANNTQLATLRSAGFPMNLQHNALDGWKTNLSWDSSTCPSDMPTNNSSNKTCIW